MTQPIVDDVTAARRALGRQLAHLRAAAGLNQRELAPLVSYGRSTIANVETGRQRMGRGFWARCDALLHANGTLITGYEQVEGLLRACRRGTAAAYARGLGIAPAHPGAPTASTEPLAVGVDATLQFLDRRRALLGAIAAVAAASGLLGRCGMDARRRIGVGDIVRLTTVTTLYRSVDYECGGGMLYADVAAFAEAASTLLDAQHGDAVRQNLLVAVADARQLAGWTAFDAGRHSDAQRHWLSAERAATAADDVRLAARVRYCQARQFQHLRYNRDALETLRLARDHLGRAGTPAITAMLAGAQAASQAALGHQSQALVSLAEASTAFDGVDPEREPPWMGFFDRGEVLAQHGRVYRDLARQDRQHGPAAVRWVTDAIDAFGCQNVRSTVLNQVGLCSALFLADQPERALAVGATVIAHAEDLTSTRVIDRIRNLRRDLTDHRHLPQVAAFDQALSTMAA